MPTLDAFNRRGVRRCDNGTPGAKCSTAVCLCAVSPGGKSSGLVCCCDAHMGLQRHWLALVHMLVWRLRSAAKSIPYKTYPMTMSRNKPVYSGSVSLSLWLFAVARSLACTFTRPQAIVPRSCCVLVLPGPAHIPLSPLGTPHYILRYTIPTHIRWTRTTHVTGNKLRLCSVRPFAGKEAWTTTF